MQVTTAYKTKTVLYGGKVLRVNAWVKYIAADKDGSLHGFAALPVAHKKKGIWCDNIDSMNLSARVDWTYREQDSGAWLHSLRSCNGDENWLLVVSGIVCSGLWLYDMGQHDAARVIFSEAARILKSEAQVKELDLQELYKTFITHAGTIIKEGGDVEVELRKMVFPEPTYRTIQYHGATIFVPVWAKWIATDYNEYDDVGFVIACAEQPVRDDRYTNWNTQLESWCTGVGWLPPTEAKAAWEEEPQRVEDLEVK